MKKNIESQNWSRFCKIIFQNDSFVSSHIDKIFNQLKCFNNLSISMNWTWYIVIKQILHLSSNEAKIYIKKNHIVRFSTLLRQTLAALVLT